MFLPLRPARLLWLLPTWFPLLLLAAAPTCVRAGEDKDTFLRDFAATRGFTLGRPTGAKPSPDGKTVYFLRARGPRDARQELCEFEVATGETHRLLTPEDVLGGGANGGEKVSAEEKARRERQRVTAGGFTSFELSRDGSFVLLPLNGKLYVLRVATGIVSEVSPTGVNDIVDPKLAPDGRSVAYVRGGDLYVLELAAHAERRVTRGATETLTHGLAEFVAQEEMGRPSGFWWSPDSKSLLYEEADAGKVESWFVTDPSRPDTPPRRQFYPRPGKNNVAVRLGVCPARENGGAKTTWLRWDLERYPYLAKVVWGAARGPLALVVQTRDQREAIVLEADPVSGATKTLWTERDPAWVNLDHEMPRWLSSEATAGTVSPLPGGGFLWTSEREGGGGPQLEVRGRDGSLRRVLVPPTAGYRGIAGVAGRDVFYRAGTDPTGFQLFRVSLDGGDPVALTNAPGQHRAEIGGSGVYVETVETPTSLRRAYVRRTADHVVLGELASVAEEPPFLPWLEFVTVGQDPSVHAVVIRPRTFDPTKTAAPGGGANAGNRRLPVIVDVYGGPGTNRVNRAAGGYLLDQWLADQGFIVVALDGRGTPGRGRDWERALAGRLGDVPLEDQAAGVQALCARFPEMDGARVGITGWSFGGYLSALAVLRRPEVFRAAVAGASVTDWLDYDTHYTERYLGVPTDGADGVETTLAYGNASLLPLARDLRRPLLLVHGTADDNVYFRHSLRLADALFRAGRPFELLPLSGFTHQLPDPVVREALGRRTAEFFRQHLLGTPENTATAAAAAAAN